MNNWIKREKYVIVNGQSKMFRIIKWVVFIMLGVLVYLFFGGEVLALAILALAIIGTSVHFLFRWKTHGWTKNWGLYKVIKTPFNEI
ncbi:MAG: hypothetical protein A2908_03475 [Candidatus Staskawiczbacteria bacterium RIFCSPLOWO2_01_FULL_38_12b]|uniref:Uncharacterized protein n=1 Tax=Candidatus Staskawiczbacteria bacterium RIFCSPLOWO2_01_FULL_38_12b TaxID=1802214 RepID=A0A1G2IHR4_9BACT|nr:MAG: hypothetical protein A2908_03475 [Candidatus Staskawiczbacteria bacterium RIFCSPLOWO2_01_FULL_38_12b]